MNIWLVTGDVIMNYEKLYDSISKITDAYFSNVDCGNCNNSSKDNMYPCKFCNNNEHTGHNMWHVSKEFNHRFTSDIIKLVREEYGFD